MAPLKQLWVSFVVHGLTLWWHTSAQQTVSDISVGVFHLLLNTFNAVVA